MWDSLATETVNMGGVNGVDGENGINGQDGTFAIVDLAEELAAEAEAKDVQDWMAAHKDDNSGFSSLGSAFDGLKI